MLTAIYLHCTDAMEGPFPMNSSMRHTYHILAALIIIIVDLGAGKADGGIGIRNLKPAPRGNLYLQRCRYSRAV